MNYIDFHKQVQATAINPILIALFIAIRYGVTKSDSFIIAAIVSTSMSAYLAADIVNAWVWTLLRLVLSGFLITDDVCYVIQGRGIADALKGVGTFKILAVNLVTLFIKTFIVIEMTYGFYMTLKSSNGQIQKINPLFSNQSWYDIICFIAIIVLDLIFIKFEEYITPMINVSWLRRAIKTDIYGEECETLCGDTRGYDEIVISYKEYYKNISKVQILQIIISILISTTLTILISQQVHTCEYGVLTDCNDSFCITIQSIFCFIKQTPHMAIFIVNGFKLIHGDLMNKICHRLAILINSEEDSDLSYQGSANIWHRPPSLVPNIYKWKIKPWISFLICLLSSVLIILTYMTDTILTLSLVITGILRFSNNLILNKVITVLLIMLPQIMFYCVLTHA